MTGFVNAQAGKISGSIKDNSNLPLVGASVIIKGTTDGVMSDFDGNFTISGLENGTYDLIISFIGYNTKNISVQVPQTNNLEIILLEDAMQLDDVVVTGVFDPRTKMEASVSISTIGA